MEHRFHEILAGLRYRSGKRQRQVAADLGISQALLSHYGNGTREPGLDFLTRACDYYGVTADYLLGRTGPDALAGSELSALADHLRDLADKLTSLSEH